ncbi:hypothetical protein IAT38_008219 [Cryptococcus sp. DSM 104549]
MSSNTPIGLPSNASTILGDGQSGVADNTAYSSQENQSMWQISNQPPQPHATIFPRDSFPGSDMSLVKATPGAPNTISCTLPFQ